MGKRYQRNEGASDRQADLDLTHDVAAKARATEGCLDFAQSTDPIESTRINLFERWISEEPMIAFRELDQPELLLPPFLAAEVMRYVTASIEAP